MADGVTIGSAAIPDAQDTSSQDLDADKLPAGLPEDPQGEQTDVPVSTSVQPFFDPSEAARIRWQRHRERQNDDLAAGVHDAKGEVLIVRVTVQTGQIIAKLAKDAQGGNTQSARELREWLKTVEIERDTDISALDAQTRQKLKARLLHEISMEGVAAQDVPAPGPIHGAQESIESAPSETVE